VKTNEYSRDPLSELSDVGKGGAMKRFPVGFAILIASFLLSAVAVAAEHFGVAVYPGARLDEEETTFLRKSAGADGFFYRTGDSVDKVTAFYQKQRGLTSLGHNKNSGRFTKEADGRTVYVNIDNPWQPSNGGDLSRDTRIVIIRE
jgi:hypothetical protein